MNEKYKEYPGPYTTITVAQFQRMQDVVKAAEAFADVQLNGTYTELRRALAALKERL